MVACRVSRVHIGKLPSTLHLFEKIIPACISPVRGPPRVCQLSLGGRGLVGAHLLCLCKSSTPIGRSIKASTSTQLLASLLSNPCCASPSRTSIPTGLCLNPTGSSLLGGPTRSRPASCLWPEVTVICVTEQLLLVKSRMCT